MLAKVITATLVAALAYVVARQIKQHNDRTKARVHTKNSNAKDRVVALREDPETGVFRPADKD